MTDRTKLIIAITAGLVGLVLAIFATIVAVNARNTAENDASVQAEVTSQVEARLDTALKEQAVKEQGQVSRAERFIRSLSKDERRALRLVAGQRASINALRRKVDAIETDQADEFSRVNKRIDATNADLASLEQRVRRIQNEIDFDGGARP